MDGVINFINRLHLSEEVMFKNISPKLKLHSLENFAKIEKSKFSKKNSENMFSDSFKIFDFEDFAAICFANDIYAKFSVDDFLGNFFYIYILTKFIFVSAKTKFVAIRLSHPKDSQISIILFVAVPSIAIT